MSKNELKQTDQARENDSQPVTPMASGVAKPKYDPKTRYLKSLDTTKEKAREKLARLYEIAHKDFELSVRTLPATKKKDPRELERQRMKFAKSLVINFEKSNHTHILATRTTLLENENQFWRVGNRSGIFYEMFIEAALERDLKRHVDNDFAFRYTDDVIVLRGNDRIDLDLEITGMKNRIIKDDFDFKEFADCIQAYKLNPPLSQADVTKFKNLRERALKKNNEKIYPAYPDLEIYQSIAFCLNAAKNIENKMTAMNRDVSERDLLHAMKRMMREYYELCKMQNKTEKRKDELLKLEMLTGDALTALACYMELDLLKMDAVEKILFELTKLRDTIGTKIAKFERKPMIMKRVEEKNEQGKKDSEPQTTLFDLV